MRCFIAGAGEYCGFYEPVHSDYVIAADAGYAALTAHGITPDLVVGDFDSLGGVPEHPNIVQTPVEKDDTDMMTAVRQGLSQGCKVFVIDGGLGGRVDHIAANLQTLAFIAKMNARGCLLGREMSATAITNGRIDFTADAIGRLSVFCLGEKAKGVTLTGLKYPLNNATLTCDFPLGVSNEFTGLPSTVSVCEGTLIIMWTGGADIVERGFFY